jgi:hypothetical protein
LFGKVFHLEHPQQFVMTTPNAAKKGFARATILQGQDWAQQQGITARIAANEYLAVKHESTSRP